MSEKGGSLLEMENSAFFYVIVRMDNKRLITSKTKKPKRMCTKRYYWANGKVITKEYYENNKKVSAKFDTNIFQKKNKDQKKRMQEK